ncbi:MAG: GntR family transcriptional regulator [Bacilli bacterium]
MSKYDEIFQQMLQRIQNEEYAEGRALPTEVELAEEFKCSRMTIKKVMSVLAKEGLIYRQRGRGSFVNLNNVTSERPVLSLNEFLPGQQQTFKSADITSEVIGFNVEFASGVIAERLGISTNEPVYHYSRVRTFDGVPKIIESNYIPVKYFPTFDTEEANISLFQYFEAKLGTKVDGALRFIRAEVATEMDVEYLKLPDGDAVLVMDALIHMHDGTLIAYSENRYQKDAFDVRCYTARRKQ